MRFELSSLRARALLLATAIGLCVPLASAQPSDVTNPLDKLDSIEKQMGQGKRDVDTLSRTAAELAADQQRIQGRLVQAAAAAQERERNLNDVEQRLAAFETREAEAMRALVSQRGKLASLLAVLQRMGREPPPALVVRPDDATAAARSAMLLSAVVPAVQTQAAKLGKDLVELRTRRQKTADERLRVAAASDALEKDRNQLRQLLDERRHLAQRAEQDLKSTQARISQLAGEAGDLRALIASLDEDAKRPRLTGTGQVIVRDIATAGVPRNSSLDGLRGLLTLPANGELVSPFGSPDGLGGKLSGVYLQTRPGSQVTSPCDGKIMFAGPFRGYGRMLIIAANGGYHVLLAGLTQMDGIVGQVVLAGEPIGRMGSELATAERTVSSGATPTARGGGRLYIEFRRNGIPVDPVPWFSALREKVSG